MIKSAPFRSEKQRRYLWMAHPEIAKKWTKEHGSKIVPSKKKKKKKKKSNYAALIIRFANIEEALAKGIKKDHPDWTHEQVCDEIDRLGEQFAKRNASLKKLSSRDFMHCPVCANASKQVGTHGPAKKYACETCGYQFSNK